MDEQRLYAARDVAQILSLPESRIHYWARTGFVGPSLRRGGRSYYSFIDLIALKTAKELLERGLTLQAARKNLVALRTTLPTMDCPLARLRVVSDGERLLVVGQDRPFEPLSGQLVMDFAVEALFSRVTQVMELPHQLSALQAQQPQTAYGWFLLASSLDESAGQAEAAARAYARALELDPALAAAHTNLGNLEHRLGHRGSAREHYQRALAIDPEQPEAHYNLGNLYDDIGEPDAAIQEWTRSLALEPDFADAHFNLGASLSRAGDLDAARSHLRHYLELDGEGAWATEARTLLERITPPP